MSQDSLFGILISSMLINNILLILFLGLCAFFGVSTKMKTSLGMGMAVIFVMVMAAAVTWIIYHLLLVPLHLEFLRTASFVLVIASLVQLVEEIAEAKGLSHKCRKGGSICPDPSQK